MKVRYKRKRLKYYLIFGILWLVLGTTAVLVNSDWIFKYLYLIIGVLFLGTYLFENNKQYLTIENGIITKNHLLPKKINLNDVEEIKKFARDYILKTAAREWRINTEWIEEDSLVKLNAVLEKLNLETR